MQILFVYDRKIIPSFGGLERVTFLLAEEFRRRGHEVTFLSVGAPELNNATVDTGFPQAHIFSGNHEFKSQFETFLKENSIDVAIFQGHNNTVVDALLASPEPLRRFIVYHYQPFPLVGKERYIKRNTPLAGLSWKDKLLKYLAITSPKIFRKIFVDRMARRYVTMARGAEKLVLLSRSFEQRLLKYAPHFPAERLVAINNPLTFNPENIKPDYSEKKNLVVFAARMSNPQKNVTGFIDVWKLFHEMHPDWQAIVAGDGEHSDLIMDYARSRGAEGLKFAGPVEDIGALYRMAKIYCMTSAYEGWGMVLTEAMAWGCVPVAYDTYESLHDIIEPGVDGITVPPFNAGAMAEAMSVLASDAGKLRRMAEGARNKIKKFNTAAIAEEWLALLDPSGNQEIR